jgi:hypothetical protein
VLKGLHRSVVVKGEAKLVAVSSGPKQPTPGRQRSTSARPSLEPHPEPDRCADLEERSGKPGPGGSPAAWWSDFVRIAGLTGSAPFGPSGNALDAPWVPLMDRSLKTLIFWPYRDYPFGQ